MTGDLFRGGFELTQPLFEECESVCECVILAEYRGQLEEFADRGPEQGREANEEVFFIANAYKAYFGEQAALLDPQFFGVKQQEEQKPTRSGCLWGAAGAAGCLLLLLVIPVTLVLLGVTSFSGILGSIGGLFGVGGMPQNPMLVLVAFFVFMAASSETRTAQLRDFTRSVRLEEAMITEFKALPLDARQVRPRDPEAPGTATL